MGGTHVSQSGLAFICECVMYLEGGEIKKNDQKKIDVYIHAGSPHASALALRNSPRIMHSPCSCIAATLAFIDAALILPAHRSSDDNAIVTASSNPCSWTLPWVPCLTSTTQPVLRLSCVGEKFPSVDSEAMLTIFRCWIDLEP